jgi:hypothetical protein
MNDNVKLVLLFIAAQVVIYIAKYICTKARQWRWNRQQAKYNRIIGCVDQEGSWTYGKDGDNCRYLNVVARGPFRNSDESYPVNLRIAIRARHYPGKTNVYLTFDSEMRLEYLSDVTKACHALALYDRGSVGTTKPGAK